MCVPVWMTQGCGRLTQMALGKRGRHVWVLLITFIVLTWVYSYSSVNPSEPYIKRSHSTKTGTESVAVVFTAGKGADDGDNVSTDRSRNSAMDGQQLLLLSAPTVVVAGNKLRVDEMPFEAEKGSAFEDGVDYSAIEEVDQPGLEEPPRVSDSLHNKNGIPENILKLIFDNQDNKNLSRQLMTKVSHLTGSKLPSWIRVNASKAYPRQKPKPQVVEEEEEEEENDDLSPDELNTWENRNIPEWVLSGFWSVLGRGKAVDAPPKTPGSGDNRQSKPVIGDSSKTVPKDETEPAVEQKLSGLKPANKDGKEMPLDPKRKADSGHHARVGKRALPRPQENIDDIALLEEPPRIPNLEDTQSTKTPGSPRQDRKQDIPKPRQSIIDDIAFLEDSPAVPYVDDPLKKKTDKPRQDYLPKQSKAKPYENIIDDISLFEEPHSILKDDDELEKKPNRPHQDRLEKQDIPTLRQSIVDDVAFLEDIPTIPMITRQPKKKQNFPRKDHLGKQDMPTLQDKIIDDIAFDEEPPIILKTDSQYKNLNYKSSDPSGLTHSKAHLHDPSLMEVDAVESYDIEVDMNEGQNTMNAKPKDADLDNPDKDSSFSLNPFHLLKHNNPIGKILFRSFVGDSNKVDSIENKPSFTSTHQSKRVKNLLPHSEFASSSKHPEKVEPTPSEDSAQRLDSEAKPVELVHTPAEHTHDHPAKVKDRSKASRTPVSDTSGTEVKPEGLGMTETDKTNLDVKSLNRLSKLNLTLWKNVQKDRKRLLRAKCQDYSTKPKPSTMDTKSIVDKKKNFLYCPVERSATSFFYRFMYSLKHSNRSKEIMSPFDVPLEAAVNSEVDTIHSFHRKGFEEFMENSIRFLVVREPYARLFSAYLDKLFVPNSFYWHKWGVPIVAKYRDSPSSKSTACGHDVTFPEFVNHVIETLHTSDEMVKPVSALCTPCELKFSLIGHVETLPSDIDYLTSVLKISIANFSSDTVMDDVIDDAIYESTHSAFEYFDELQSCISKLEMAKKLWKKMKLRGIINDELAFTFAPRKVEKMTSADFISAVNAAREASTDSEKLLEQKVRAMEKAFQQVPTENIMKLVKIYSLDFEFFGYDKHPAFLP